MDVLYITVYSTLRTTHLFITFSDGLCREKPFIYSQDQYWPHLWSPSARSSIQLHHSSPIRTFQINFVIPVPPFACALAVLIQAILSWCVLQIRPWQNGQDAGVLRMGSSPGGECSAICCLWSTRCLPPAPPPSKPQLGHSEVNMKAKITWNLIKAHKINGQFALIRKSIRYWLSGNPWQLGQLDHGFLQYKEMSFVLPSAIFTQAAMKLKYHNIQVAIQQLSRNDAFGASRW